MTNKQTHGFSRFLGKVLSSRIATVVLLFVAACVLAYGVSAWWYSGVCDDAYITFRHSSNLVQGHGPVFNPGEKVEGYTTPVWMLLMSAAIVAGLNPVLISKILAIAASVALVVFLYAALRRAGTPRAGAAFAALLAASSPMLHEWSVSGMETSLYTLLFFAGVERLTRPDITRRGSVVASLLLIAAALTHPESLAFWGFGAIYVAVSRKSDRYRHTLVYLAPGLILLAHFVWRYSYYGALLPNTYYAKTGAGFAALPMGYRELEKFISDPAHMILLLLAGIGWGAVQRRPNSQRATLLAIAAILQALYVVSIGGDHMYVFRLYLPILPLLAFLAGLSFIDSRNKAPSPAVAAFDWRPAATALAILLVVPLNICMTHTRYLPPFRRLVRYYEGNEKLGRHLAENCPAGTLIAVQAAGAIPYLSGLPTIDMFGLNDSHIAGLPFPNIKQGGLLKWDIDYVLSRRPDIIVINGGYLEQGDPRLQTAINTPAPLLRHIIDDELFTALRARDTYRYHPIRFKDSSTFFIFRRYPPPSHTYAPTPSTLPPCPP